MGVGGARVAGVAADAADVAVRRGGDGGEGGEEFLEALRAAVGAAGRVAGRDEGLERAVAVEAAVFEEGHGQASASERASTSSRVWRRPTKSRKSAPSLNTMR